MRRPAPPPEPPLAVAPQMTVAVPPTPAPLPSAPHVTARADRADVPLPATGQERRVAVPERAQRPPTPLMVPQVVAPAARPEKPSVPAVIDLSNLSVELERNPAYVEYFRTVRERIRRAAQRNFPAGSRQGEVYVYFVLRANGQLLSVELESEHSSPDPALRRASVDSVQQGAPFPPFPPAFNQPQITFRIVIEYSTAAPAGN